MSLDLNLSQIPGPGRKSLPLVVEDVREATKADIELLMTNQSIEPDPIKTIKARHHTIARALASGMKEGEVAVLVGITPSRLSVLKRSPAMADLINLYSENVQAEFAPVIATMANLAQDALGELAHRLEEEPEKLSPKQLQDIAEMTLDRIGHPRVKETNTNVVVDMSSRIDAARQRAKKAAQQSAEDAEVIDDRPAM